MNTTLKVSRNFEAIAWGALFIWWGITVLVPSLPKGAGVIGIGLILVGANIARQLSGVPINRFSMTIGILAVVWGALELVGALLSLPFELPVRGPMRFGQDNTVAVLADNTRRPGEVPGLQRGWRNTGGILREVAVVTSGPRWIDEVRLTAEPAGDTG